MCFENTRTKYLAMLEVMPYQANELQHLIRAVLLDCRNESNRVFADMESEIRNIGKIYPPTKSDVIGD